MGAYDASRFSPPAPVAHVEIRDPKSGNSVSNVLMLVDSGADIENFREAKLSPSDPAPVLTVTITECFPKTEAGARFLLRRAQSTANPNEFSNALRGLASARSQHPELHAFLDSHLMDPRLSDGTALAIMCRPKSQIFSFRKKLTIICPCLTTGWHHRMRKRHMPLPNNSPK